MSDDAPMAWGVERIERELPAIAQTARRFLLACSRDDEPTVSALLPNDMAHMLPMRMRAVGSRVALGLTAEECAELSTNRATWSTWGFHNSDGALVTVSLGRAKAHIRVIRERGRWYAGPIAKLPLKMRLERLRARRPLMQVEVDLGPDPDG